MRIDTRDILVTVTHPPRQQRPEDEGGSNNKTLAAIPL
jgi:hypothetical protein